MCAVDFENPYTDAFAIKLLDSGEVLEVEEADEETSMKPKKKEEGVKKKSEEKKVKEKGKGKGKRKPLPATYEPGKCVKLGGTTNSLASPSQK